MNNQMGAIPEKNVASNALDGVEGLTERELLVMLHKAVQEAGSNKAFAEAVGISPQYLCDMVTCRRAIGLDVGRYLGFTRVVRWERQTSQLPISPTATYLEKES